jgi:hypothetical protein
MDTDKHRWVDATDQPFAFPKTLRAFLLLPSTGRRVEDEGWYYLAISIFEKVILSQPPFLSVFICVHLWLIFPYGTHPNH